MSNEPDKVNSGALATMIVLVAFATLAVALVVTALVRQETARLQAEGDQNQERPFRQLRSEQESKLSDAPAWADQAAGLASIPINSAMQLVLEEVRENPLAMSPGNKPEEEEEESEEGEEAAEEGASDPQATEETAETAEEGEPEKVPAQKPEPAPKAAPAPAPKATPAPTPKASPAPAPKAPAPAPKAPAPVPGVPAQ